MVNSLEPKKINKFSRYYKNSQGEIVAISFNQYGLDSDYTTNYFCLNGIFEPDANTQIVNQEELQNIYQRCLTLTSLIVQ